VLALHELVYGFVADAAEPLFFCEGIGIALGDADGIVALIRNTPHFHAEFADLHVSVTDAADLPPGKKSGQQQRHHQACSCIGAQRIATAEHGKNPGHVRCSD